MDSREGWFFSVWPFSNSEPGALRVKVVFEEASPSRPLVGVRIRGSEADRLVFVDRDEGTEVSLPPGVYHASVGVLGAPKPVEVKVKAKALSEVTVGLRYPAIFRSSVRGVAELVERSEWENSQENSRVRPLSRVMVVVDRELHKPELASCPTDDEGRFWMPVGKGDCRVAVVPLSRANPLLARELRMPSQGCVDLGILRAHRLFEREQKSAQAISGEVRLKKFPSRDAERYSPARGRAFRITVRTTLGRLVDDRLIGATGAFYAPLPPGNYGVELSDPSGRIVRTERVALKKNEVKRLDFDLSVYRDEEIA